MAIPTFQSLLGAASLGGSFDADILAAQQQLSAALEDVREERFAAESQHLDAVVELNQAAAADVASAFRGGLSEVRRQFRTLEFDARSILGAIVGDLASSLLDSALGSFTGGTGLFGLIGTWFQGGFAEGGAVAANQAALVGEQGPELFVPGAPGTIVPHGALGGTIAVHQTFNVNEGATEGAVRMLYTVAREIKRQTIAAVIDGQRRTAGALL